MCSITPQTRALSLAAARVEVADDIDVDLDRASQELVDQHRRIGEID
jgi:hypothetical protein